MVSIIPADKSKYSSDTSTLIALEGQKRMGYINFKINGEEVVILAGEAEDEILMEGLIRAALNSARSKGAVTALCSLEQLFELLGSIGFVNNDSDNGQSHADKHVFMQADISSALRGKCGG